MGSVVAVKIKRLDASLHPTELPLPCYQTRLSAGADLCAAVGESIDLLPGQRALVPTGLALELPVGYEAQIRPRSGLALKRGITTLNAPGTIDADYRGEIGVILINHGDDVFTIKRGDRIAQMVIASVIQGRFEISEELSSTDRSDGGFGHTGLNRGEVSSG